MTDTPTANTEHEFVDFAPDDEAILVSIGERFDFAPGTVSINLTANEMARLDLLVREGKLPAASDVSVVTER